MRGVLIGLAVWGFAVLILLAGVGAKQIIAAYENQEQVVGMLSIMREDTPRKR